MVAIIEIVSPGNKDSRQRFQDFMDKAITFLKAGVNLVVVDLFPPTRRDPQGIHQAIWENFTDDSPEARPADKPLTVASYDAADPLTAYVDPVAVGDTLPDAYLFLARGWHVNVPLETTLLRLLGKNTSAHPRTSRGDHLMSRRTNYRDRTKKRYGRLTVNSPLPLSRDG